MQKEEDRTTSNAAALACTAFEPETEEIDMTTYDNSSPMGVTKLPAPPFWVCVLLGLVMILAGFLCSGMSCWSP